MVNCILMFRCSKTRHLYPYSFTHSKGVVHVSVCSFVCLCARNVQVRVFIYYTAICRVIWLRLLYTSTCIAHSLFLFKEYSIAVVSSARKPIQTLCDYFMDLICEHFKTGEQVHRFQSVAIRVSRPQGTKMKMSWTANTFLLVFNGTNLCKFKFFIHPKAYSVCYASIWICYMCKYDVWYKFIWFNTEQVYYEFYHGKC